MNKQIYLIILLLTCRICNAQNLVPNGDFEQFTTCPVGLSQLNKVVSWMNPSLGSPDYFNQCTADTMVDVPKNYFGFQQAHSGVAYVGCYTFYKTNPNAREFIEVMLNSQLLAGTTYYFEMYVSLSELCQYTFSDFGVYFSDTAVWLPIGTPLPFTPQITNPSGVLMDTISWALVSGNYTAVGGENYLIIGNFKDDAAIDTSFYNPSPPPIAFPVAYVYVDDVSLTVATGLTDYDSDENVNIYPNPLHEQLNITNNQNENLEIIIYDIASRKIFNQSLTNSTSINTTQLAKGIYLYEVRNKSGVIKKGKVVKD